MEAARPVVAACEEPCLLVVFGASGDLMQRKLAPALFELLRQGLLPRRFAIVGVSRREHDADTLREHLRASLAGRDPRGGQPGDDPVWRRFAGLVHMVRADLESAGGFVLLRDELARIDRAVGAAGNRLFYLATPPSAFEGLLTGLRRAGLIARPGGHPWTRVVIEKPFGRDAASARALNALISAGFDESQVFRIDHFLGKETVQNILVLRFGNSIFEPLWNRKYVSHVEITAGETLGVEDRAAFYDEVGVVRDMVQNHLLQVLALVAMEPPLSFRADDVRDARVQLFRSLRPLLPHEVAAQAVLGRYAGYSALPAVPPGSCTPTFVALKVFVDNWRWQGVPFYLRTGKRLPRRTTEVVIRFQPIPLCLFGSDEVCSRTDANELVLRLQPDEGIALHFAAKRPGEALDIARVAMDFRYDEAFGASTPEAYQRLLLDALRGDATLFIRRDEVERCWDFVEPLLGALHGESPVPLHEYAPGSDGPAAAATLTAEAGHAWTALSAATRPS